MGWIKVDKDIIGWEWFQDGNMVRLWLYLLVRANHAPKRVCGVDLQPGQIKTTLPELSEAMGLTIKQIRTCLGRLENGSQISQKRAAKFRVITICEQGNCEFESFSDGRQMADKRAGKGQSQQEEGSPHTPLKKNNNNKYNNPTTTTTGACAYTREGESWATPIEADAKRQQEANFLARARGSGIWIREMVEKWGQPPDRIQALLGEFDLHCRTVLKTHTNYQDFIQHFNNWLIRRKNDDTRNNNKHGPAGPYTADQGREERARAIAAAMQQLAAEARRPAKPLPF